MASLQFLGTGTAAAQHAWVCRIVCVAALLALLLGGCKKDSDEDLIRARIRESLDGVHKKDVGEVIKFATEDFRAGSADLRDVKRTLLGFMLREGWLRAFEKDLVVVVGGNRAQADLDVVIAKGQPIERVEDLVPTQATRLQIHFELEKMGGDGWMYKKADYKEVPVLEGL